MYSIQVQCTSRLQENKTVCKVMNCFCVLIWLWRSSQDPFHKNKKIIVTDMRIRKKIPQVTILQQKVVHLKKKIVLLQRQKKNNKKYLRTNNCNSTKFEMAKINNFAKVDIKWQKKWFKVKTWICRTKVLILETGFIFKFIWYCIQISFFFIKKTQLFLNYQIHKRNVWF